MFKNTKVALVTGAAGAIGKAIVEGLVAKGYAVTAAVRTERQGNALVHDVGGTVRFKTCDLSRHNDIYALTDDWEGPLHVLINDAATCPRRRTDTAEYIEMQFAVNVLGYYRMIQGFSDILKRSTPARVVNVASYWAGGLDLNDLEFNRRSYDNDTAYRQSKQADRMLAKGFADQFSGTGVTVNSCHPGDVRSKVSTDLGFGGHETPAQGAATPLYLATAPELDGVTGRYFAHLQEERCRFSEDTKAVQRLLEICGSYDR